MKLNRKICFAVQAAILLCCPAAALDISQLYEDTIAGAPYINDTAERLSLEAFIHLLRNASTTEEFRNISGGLNIIPSTRRFKLSVAGEPRFLNEEELDEKERKKTTRSGYWAEIPACTLELTPQSQFFFERAMLPAFLQYLKNSGAQEQPSFTVPYAEGRSGGGPWADVSFKLPKGTPKGAGCIIICMKEKNTVRATPYVTKPDTFAPCRSGWQDKIAPSLFAYAVSADGKCLDKTPVSKPGKGGMAVAPSILCTILCPDFLLANGSKISPSLSTPPTRVFFPKLKKGQASTCRIIVSYLPAEFLFKH